MLKFILQSEKAVAVDSPDHLVPRGTKQDNSRNTLFNKKLYALVGRQPLQILDFGCAGGGFVKDCIDNGHIAIGIEGSDYSQKISRAEWSTIPNNLFTGDLTAKLYLKAVDEASGQESELKFDVITAWEFMEHIKTEDLPQICKNAIRHLKKGGIWIMSIADFEDVVDGVRFHQTVQSQDWWENFFRSAGFRNHPHLVNYFGNDWVRGPLQGSRSFHLILTYGDDEPPAIPSTPAYDTSDLYQTGVMFFNQGVTTRDGGNLYYALLCFDEAIKLCPQDSEIHYARAMTLLNLGRFAEAQVAAKSVLVLQPNHAGAHAILATITPQVPAITKVVEEISATSVSKPEAEVPDSSLPIHINLSEINLIVFPDWSQPEESVSEDLAEVIRTVLTHPEKSRLALLIDTSNIAEENANLILSGVMMKLLLQEDLMVDEQPEIFLVGKLNEMQWKEILRSIYYLIVLEKENKQAIVQVGADHITTVEVEGLKTKIVANSTRALDIILAQIQSLPPDWHKDGVLSGNVLQAIVKNVKSRHILHSVETGCGVSTLLLSHISQNHKCFSLADGNSMSAVRSSSLLNKATVEFIEGPTQQTLPPYKFKNKLQLALIDGPHGYPFPDMEYYFIYPHLEENGMLIVDDIHIPNIYNLFMFLREEEMFELIEVVGNTGLFRRTDAPLFSPVEDGWWLQNYNKKGFPIAIK